MQNINSTTAALSTENNYNEQDDEGGGGLIEGTNIIIVIIGFISGLILLLIIIWYGRYRMILKQRLKQLTVHKKRGKILLEGVIHYIQLNTQRSDFSVFLPDLHLSQNSEQIPVINKNKEDSDQLSLSWIRHQSITAIGRFKESNEHHSDFELQDFVDLLSYKIQVRGESASSVSSNKQIITSTKTLINQSESDINKINNNNSILKNQNPKTIPLQRKIILEEDFDPEKMNERLNLTLYLKQNNGDASIETYRNDTLHQFDFVNDNSIALSTIRGEVSIKKQLSLSNIVLDENEEKK